MLDMGVVQSGAKIEVLLVPHAAARIVRLRGSDV
jgi:hypothetical protein